jgi:hypothetical protein
MKSRRHVRRSTIAAAVAALGLTAAAWPAAAQTAQPIVTYVLKTDAPPTPAGLQLVCVSVPNSGAPSSPTCPVVKYKDVTTWAFSYADNRVSMALVSYDNNNNVIANVEKPGARYVFSAEPSAYTQTVIFFGQEAQYVTATWAELGPK